MKSVQFIQRENEDKGVIDTLKKIKFLEVSKLKKSRSIILGINFTSVPQNLLLEIQNPDDLF